MVALDYLERYAALFHYLGLTSMAKLKRSWAMCWHRCRPMQDFCDSLAVRSPSCR